MEVVVVVVLAHHSSPFFNCWFCVPSSLISVRLDARVSVFARRPRPLIRLRSFYHDILLENLPRPCGGDASDGDDGGDSLGARGCWEE